MSDFRKFVNGQLQDPEFRKEYDVARLQSELARSLIAARVAAGLTQKDLAKKAQPPATM